MDLALAFFLAAFASLMHSLLGLAILIAIIFGPRWIERYRLPAAFGLATAASIVLGWAPASAQTVVEPSLPMPTGWAATFLTWGPIVRDWLEFLWPFVILPGIIAGKRYLDRRGDREQTKEDYEAWGKTIDTTFNGTVSMMKAIDAKDVVSGNLSQVAKDAMNAVMRDSIKASPIHAARAAAVGLTDLDSVEAQIRVGKAMEARLGAKQMDAAGAQVALPIWSAPPTVSGGTMLLSGDVQRQVP